MERKKLKEIEPILKELKENLEKIYGDRLKGIILYGSYARGDATEGSDIDLIILLESLEDFHAEVDRLLEITWPLDLKHDTLISILPLEEREYKTRRLPVILNAKREGLPIEKL